MSNRRIESPAAGASSVRTTRPPRWRADYGIAAVILLFCAVVVVLTTTFEKVPLALSQGIPPEEFPRLIVGLIVFLTLVMALQARAQPDSKRKAVPGMVYFTAALLSLFVAAIDWLGTMPTVFLFCLAMPILWGERRYLLVLVYAVLFPIAIYLLFSQLLQVRFPAGSFTSLLG